MADPPPRYDSVFFEGLDWLESIAWGPTHGGEDMTDQELLGTILLDNGYLDDVDFKRTFQDPRDQAIFAAMTELCAEGQPVDTITVRERTIRHGTWGKNGLNDEYLLGLCELIDPIPKRRA